MLGTSIGSLTPSVSFETNKIESNNLLVVRSEISQTNYTYRAKGKYTTEIFKNSFSVGSHLKKQIESEDFENAYCNEHEDLKEFIIFEDVNEEHRKYDNICKVCLSELNRNLKRQVKTQLWDTVILNHKDKIWQIQNNKLNINSVSYGSEAGSILRDSILTLADELIYISETFETEITSKIYINSTKTEQIKELKEFIGKISLNENNEPILKGIGKQEDLKKQYIKLALFLLQFSGIKTDSVAQYSLSASLKAHLIAIIQLRRLIVLKLTEWIRFLCGNFYEYIFSLEGLQVDYEFIRGLQIEFFSDEDYQKNESKYKIMIENIRIEYEKRISELNIQINHWTNKFKEIELKYSTDNNVYIKQIENLKIQINELNIQITNIHNLHPKQVRALSLIKFY